MITEAIIADEIASWKNTEKSLPGVSSEEQASPRGRGRRIYQEDWQSEVEECSGNQSLKKQGEVQKNQKYQECG